MNVPPAYRIQDYAEAGAWVLFCGLLAHTIWKRTRTQQQADDDRADWATLTHCDLQALEAGESQTVQTGQGDRYRLEAVDVETNTDE